MGLLNAEEHASPFFIVGASRSGTTLLRLMLNSHPSVAVPHEMDYFHKAIPLSLLRRWQNPGLSAEAFERLIDGWLDSRRYVFEDVGLEHVRKAILDGPRDLRAPFSRAMQQWAAHHGKSRWGAKTPKNLFFVDIIAEMFPRARFIYLARDPRAVVRSMNNFEFFSDDTVINAFNWRTAATEGRELLAASVPENRRYLVRYESIATKPEETLRSVCGFLELPFVSDMLYFHEGPRSAFPETVRTSNIRKPVTEASVTKWKSELSVQGIAAVESICDAPMRQMGYEPTGAALHWSTRFDIALKSLYWAWKKRRASPQRGFTMKYKPFVRLRS